MILATDRLSLCHFPFSKMENTVDFFASRSTCFIACHISLQSNHPLRLRSSDKNPSISDSFPRDWCLKFRIFSVHSPMVSTIGGAYLPEVVILIPFHFSKFWCYLWGFASFNTLKLQRNVLVSYFITGILRIFGPNCPKISARQLNTCTTLSLII